MAELLFILTVIYVAYVIFKISNEPKIETRSNVASPILMPTFKLEAVVVKSMPLVEEKIEEIVEVESVVVSSSHLRHPESGEIVKVTNNYRGLKRWLKEALVTEGLLEKVYATSELNDETNAEIRKALEIIKTLSKYHA